MDRERGEGRAAHVRLEDLGDGVSRITLCRPQQRNAMNHEMRCLLLEALEECREASRVVIVTGEGPAFCAGIDLKEKRDDVGREWLAVLEAVRTHPAIVIASVNGYALGGGLTLVNASSLALAAEEAEFGTPEITFGVYAAMAGPSIQLRVSSKHAAWMILTGERIDGHTALEWGLVNRCVPLQQLADETLAVARRIAAYDPAVLRCSKKGLWEIPAHISDWTSALEYGVLLGAQVRAQKPAQRHSPDAVAPVDGHIDLEGR